MLTRKCGDGERRSDINLLENQLTGFSTDDLPPGGSVFVRMYFKVPPAPDGPSPSPIQKLFRFADSQGFKMLCELFNESTSPRSRAITCEGAFSQDIRGFVEDDTWIYVEAEMQAASTSGGNDGAFRVWVAKDGQPIDRGQPNLERTGLSIAGAGRAGAFVVMIGNSPSRAPRAGALWFDDLSVATTFHGQNVGIRAQAPDRVTVE